MKKVLFISLIALCSCGKSVNEPKEKVEDKNAVEEVLDNDFDLDEVVKEQEKNIEVSTDSMFNMLNDEEFEQDTISID